jgi:hypothetical protein
MLVSAERAAESIRDAAGVDDEAGAVEVAFALMGKHAILLCHKLPEKAVYRPDTDRIWLRRELSRNAVEYLVGHELGERHAVQSGLVVTDEERETFCDAVAARLLAPRRLVRDAVRAFGDDHVAVAKALRTTQTIALVRMAEEAHRPLVAVLPKRIIVRGDVDFAWPDEETLRGLEDGPVPEGVERREITDARRRFGLLAA